MKSHPFPELRSEIATQLASFFSPRTIAIVGASDSSMWSLAAFHNLRAMREHVYLVNPKREIVHGQKVFASVLDIPVQIDTALVLTDKVEGVMADAAACGIKNIVPIAAGFAEAGPAGVERQLKLVETARASGQLIFGPNNMGFVNLHRNIWCFTNILPDFRAGGVALVTQSGAVVDNIRNIIVAKDIGISHALTVGNEAMIDVVDCVNYLVEDDNCRVIALFMESIRDPQAFMAAALRAFEAGKPIVACKIGRSEKGKRAAEAHTGGLAADDKVVDAVFRQLGVIRVDSVEDMLVTAAVLDGYGELPGDRLAFIAGSGAACGMVCDLAEKHGIELSDLSEATKKTLREEVLPPFAAAQNPLDFTAYAVMDPTLPPNAMRVLASDENTDAVVHITANLPQEESPHTALMDQAVQRMVKVYKESSKPFIHMDFFSIDYSTYAREYRLRQGMPFVVPSIEKGVPALARVLWWSRRRREGLGMAQGASTGGEAIEHAGAWSEADARDFLAGEGVPVVPARLVVSADDAVATAQEFGGPVAMKLVSAQIAHKSDIGGVKLGVRGEASVREAFEAIRAAGKKVVDAKIDGVLVSPMRSGGVEMLVGVVRDPQWGPVLAIGLGGVFVEILGDSALRVLPVSRDEIGRMIDELAGKALLEGARGAVAADRERLIDVIGAIAAAALKLGDRLEAIEVNPLRVHGKDIEALDALISWRAEDEIVASKEGQYA